MGQTCRLKEGREGGTKGRRSDRMSRKEERETAGKEGRKREVQGRVGTELRKTARVKEW